MFYCSLACGSSKMDDVLKLVDENPYLEIFKDDSGKEKVKCKLTGHQLPCRSSEVMSYTKGKKYQRLLKSMAGNNKAEDEKQGCSLEDYKQYLVPAEKRKNQLYCKVTKKLINDMPHHIELHVKGKRFQKALKKYEESKSDETPDQGEDDSNLWEPSDTESTPEPDIDPLPDSFDEDSDDDEDGVEAEVDDNDDDDVDDEKDNTKKKSNSNKTSKQSKKKVKANKNKNENNKLPNTRKRNLKEEASKQKETPKKIKKQSKSKVPLRKNLGRKAKK